MVLGSNRSGRTATIVRLVCHEFHDDYWHDPTIEDQYRKYLEVDGSTAKLDIYDPWPGEDYSEIKDEMIRRSNGFVLIYSIIDRVSFDKAKSQYTEILQQKDDERFDLVLVGNKVDLCDGNSSRHHGRQVSYREGEELAREWNIPFFEQSAKENVNVFQTFESLIRLMREPREVVVEPESKGCAVM